MSNNKQSSSVEWFAQESWKLRVELEDDKISLGEYANKYYQLKEQAREMEKEQKADTWNNAINAVEKDKWDSFEQFYEQTYEGNK